MTLIRGRDIQLDSDSLESVLDELGIKIKTDSGLLKSVDGILVDAQLSLQDLGVASFIRIGVTTSETTAIFQTNSTEKGVLIPRVTTALRDSIVTPVDGLFVYNTDTKQLEWFNDTIWTTFSSESLVLEVNGVDSGATPNLVDSVTVAVAQVGNDIDFTSLTTDFAAPSIFGSSRYVLVDPTQASAVDDSSFLTPFITITGALSALQTYFLALSSSTPTLYELTKGAVVYVAAGVYAENISWTYTALEQVTIQGLVPLSSNLPLGSTVVAEQLAYGAAVIKGVHNLSTGNLVFKNIYFRYPTSGAGDPLLIVQKIVLEDCIAVIRSSAQDTGVGLSTCILFIVSESNVTIRRSRLMSAVASVSLISDLYGIWDPSNPTPGTYDMNPPLVSSDPPRIDLHIVESEILNALGSDETTIRSSLSSDSRGIMIWTSGDKRIEDSTITGMLVLGDNYYNSEAVPGVVSRENRATIVRSTLYGADDGPVFIDGMMSRVKDNYLVTSGSNLVDAFIVPDVAGGFPPPNGTRGDGVVTIKDWGVNFIGGNRRTRLSSATSPPIVETRTARVNGEDLLLLPETAKLPASNPASVIVVTQDSVPYRVVSFNDTASSYVYFNFLTPSNIFSLGSLYLTWFGTSIGTGTEQVYWEVASAVPGWSDSFTTPSYFTQSFVSSVDTSTVVPVKSGPYTIKLNDAEDFVGAQDNLTRNDLSMVIRIGRLASSGADTFSGAAYLLGANIVYTHRS